MAAWIRDRPVSSSIEEFVGLIKKARAAVPSDVLESLYVSMPGRLLTVKEKNGAAI
jgi:hypothetical protein